MSISRHHTDPQSPNDAATGWFEQLRHGELSEAEMLEWLSWYEENEANSRAFDELQDFWRLSHGLADEGQFVDRMKRSSWWSRCAWRIEDWFDRQRGEERSGRPSYRLIAWSAGAAGAAAALLLLGFSFRSVLSITRSPALTLGVTPVRSMVLSDESRVELAPNTSLAVNYSAQERRLEMGVGEANFVVAPNKERPFVVQLDQLRVRAVGTQFDIHRAADRIVVTVIQGKIDVYRDPTRANSPLNLTQAADDAGLVRVNAGQQYVEWKGAGAPSVTAVDARQALVWREGQLRYVDAPISEVIEDVNRYVGRPVVIGDDSLKSLRYTGTVFTHLIDEWLTAIPKEFPLVVVTEADRTVLLARTPGASQQ